MISALLTRGGLPRVVPRILRKYSGIFRAGFPGGKGGEEILAQQQAEQPAIAIHDGYAATVMLVERADDFTEPGILVTVTAGAVIAALTGVSWHMMLEFERVVQHAQQQFQEGIDL